MNTFIRAKPGQDPFKPPRPPKFKEVWLLAVRRVHADPTFAKKFCDKLIAYDVYWKSLK